MELAKNFRMYIEDGVTIFEDEQMKVKLIEDISDKTILWDEYNGYVIAEDGRNVRELIVEEL